MSKRPHGHGELKNMRDFKALAVDYEYYLTLSDKPQSVCLTERQMYVLSVQNTYTSWLTRWYNTEDITQQTVQFIAAEIEELLMCGCGIPEPSFSDYIATQNYYTTNGASYTTTYNTWNTAGQTVSSIAPNLDYATGTPADIDKLMCLAYKMLLTTVIESAKTQKAQPAEDQLNTTKALTGVFGALATAGGAALIVGGTAAAFVTFLGGPLFVMGMAFAAVGTAVASLVNGVDLGALTNEDAIEAVYCVMVQNSVGVTPTRDVFQGALEPNTFGPGSPEAEIVGLVQPYLDDLDVYLQFLVMGNGLYDASDFAVLPDCGCAVPVVPIIDPDGMWIGGSYNGTVGGMLTNLGDGLWRGTPTLAGDGNYHIAIKEATDQNFKMIDLAIFGSMICEGWKMPVGEFFDGCSSTEQYAEEVIQTIWWIQNTIAPGSYIEFRIESA